MSNKSNKATKRRSKSANPVYVAMRERRLKAGLCSYCGKKPLAKGSRSGCDKCLVTRRKSMRKKRGGMSRADSGVGRKPITRPSQ